MTGSYDRTRSESAESGHIGQDSAASAAVGVWLSLSGSLSILLGIAGVAQDSLFRTPAAYAYQFDLTAWGWINLVIGIVLGIAGLGVLAGAGWGRAVGAAAAVASLITQFMFLPYYPWWSISVMTLDLLAVWTLARIGAPR
jgi:hypothetical protein